MLIFSGLLCVFKPHRACVNDSTCVKYKGSIALLSVIVRFMQILMCKILAQVWAAIQRSLNRGKACSQVQSRVTNITSYPQTC